MSPDAKDQRLVNSSKVPKRKNPNRTRPVNADRTLIKFRLLTGRCSASDRTLEVQRPVDISKVLVRGKHDRTCPVSVDQTLPASGQLLTTGVRGVLTGTSGHPTEAHNGSFFSQCYKYNLRSCVGVLLLIPTAEKHLRECQKEQGSSEVIEI